MKEAGFVVTGLYMPYFRLLLFVNSEQYGEGEISRDVIFVSVHHFCAFLFCTYSLFSGSWLSIINHCFVWLHTSYLRLPPLFVPC